MGCADGKTRKPTEPSVPLAESGPRQPVSVSRLVDYRRRLLDGSLQADPRRIAHALLRRGIIR
jgi:hypothetical protein